MAFGIPFPFVLPYPISLPMPLLGEPGSPYLDVGDAEDDVVKFFKDLEALFRQNAVIDEELKPITVVVWCVRLFRHHSHVFLQESIVLPGPMIRVCQIIL